MEIGLLLSIAGLVVLIPFGSHGYHLIGDPAQRFDAVVVLLAIGLSLLLTSRRPFAYWLVCTAAGAIGYVGEQNGHWAPPGWHDRILIISVVVFAQGTLLSVLPAPRDDSAAVMLLAATAGLLWLAHHYRAHLPWAVAWFGFIVDGLLVLGAVVVGLRLRSAHRDRAGFVLAAGGAAMFALEQVQRWAPPGWHGRVLSASLIAAVIGLLAGIYGHLEHHRYDRIFLLSLGWGAGALVVGGQPIGRLRIGPPLAGILQVAAAALFVLALLAAANIAITLVADSVESCRAVAPLCRLLVDCAAAGYLLAVVAIATLRLFGQSGAARFGLGTLAVLGLGAGFALLWAVVVAIADRNRLNRTPQSPEEAGDFLFGSLLAGPGGLGQGPAVGYAGLATLLSCAAVLQGPAAWFTLGLLGGLLTVAGSALTAVRRLSQVRERAFGAGADPAATRLSERQFEQHEQLVPVAVAAGGLAVVLLFVVRSDHVAEPFRVVLSFVVIAGFAVASAAPLLFLVALQGTEMDIAWRSALGDQGLGRPGRWAYFGLVTGAAAVVWATSFQPASWFRSLLTVVALIGFGALFSFGVIAISGLTGKVRSGDRTLTDRARRLSASHGRLYRLLPDPPGGEQPWPELDLEPYRWPNPASAEPAASRPLRIVPRDSGSGTAAGRAG